MSEWVSCGVFLCRYRCPEVQGEREVSLPALVSSHAQLVVCTCYIDATIHAPPPHNSIHYRSGSMSEGRPGIAQHYNYIVVVCVCVCVCVVVSVVEGEGMFYCSPILQAAAYIHLAPVQIGDKG